MKNSKLKYPAQIGAYKVKVKNGSRWQNFDHCRIQVSVGHGDKHEGEKFLATFNWAYNRFDKVIICVNDTLQRFNFMANYNLSEQDAYKKSKQAGEEWIAKNIANELLNDKKIEIICWDYWLSLPDYKKNFNLVSNLYQNNQVLKQAVNEEIEMFLLRRDKQVFDHKKECSKYYFLEETAAFPLMFKRERAADIYAGTTLLPVRLAEEGKIEGICPSNNVVFTRIDFVKTLKSR